MKKSLILILFLSIGILMAQVPDNNECAGSIDISDLFGQGINVTTSTSNYDNTLATTEASDPNFGYDCFGEPDASGSNPSLENTLWFSFMGDGNTYLIETTNCENTASPYISDGDTQIAIYSGLCGDFTAVGCNEDGPSATNTSYPAGITFETESGVQYYMLIDGYADRGRKSIGNYCITATQTAGCEISGFSAGDVSMLGGESSACVNGDLSVISFAFDGNQTHLDLSDNDGYAWRIMGPSGSFLIFGFDELGTTLEQLNLTYVANDYELVAGDYCMTGIIYSGYTGGSFTSATCYAETDTCFSFTLFAATDSLCLDYSCTDPNFSGGSIDLTDAISEVCIQDLSNVILKFDGSQTTGLDATTETEGYAWVVNSDQGRFYTIWGDEVITLQDIQDLYASVGLNVALGQQDIEAFVFAELDTTISINAADARCLSSATNSYSVTVLSSEDSSCIPSAVVNTEILNVSYIYPVPTQDILNIEFFSIKSGNANIAVYDLLGRNVETKDVRIESGKNSLKYNINSFNNGAYFATIQLEGYKTTFKFIKK